MAGSVKFNFPHEENGSDDDEEVVVVVVEALVVENEDAVDSSLSWCNIIVPGLVCVLVVVKSGSTGSRWLWLLFWMISAR